MGVHRSRFELERVLGRYGASDFAFVEADANASIQFALQGRYVQLALPLPDPDAEHFTHTASGRPRTVVAQERAYEQALREHWRALLLAVRGKLQSVESGISTFEDEFAGFLVPQFHEQKTARRKKSKAVTWLLGSSHSLAIALVAAFLVPASAVGAFALPPNVVDHLAAPFRGALPDQLAVPGEHARAVALGQSSWLRDETGSHGDLVSPTAERDFAAAAPEGDDAEPGSSGSEAVPAAEVAGLRQGAGVSAGGPAPAPSQSAGPSGGQASGGDKQGGQSSGAPGGSGDAPASSDDAMAEDEQTPGAEESEVAGDSAQPLDGGETPESGTESSDSGDGAVTSDPGTDSESQPGDPDSGHDNGNHNGADNGNKNGADNGNKNGADNGNKSDAPAAPAGDAGNGNKNGAEKKTDAPADDQPKPGKGGPKAGP